MTRSGALQSNKWVVTRVSVSLWNRYTQPLLTFLALCCLQFSLAAPLVGRTPSLDNNFRQTRSSKAPLICSGSRRACATQRALCGAHVNMNFPRLRRLPHLRGRAEGAVICRCSAEGVVPAVR